MTVAELVEDVRSDAMERLRWRVLRHFRVLPCSPEARAMTDEDCIRFACHMIADTMEGESVNPAFDGARFVRMKEAERG